MVGTVLSDFFLREGWEERWTKHGSDVMLWTGMMSEEKEEEEICFFFCYECCWRGVRVCLSRPSGAQHIDRSSLAVAAPAAALVKQTTCALIPPAMSKPSGKRVSEKHHHVTEPPNLLLGLPPELVLRVFAFTAPDALFALRLLCRQVSKAASESFVARVASLIKETDNPALVALVHCVRGNAGRLMGVLSDTEEADDQPLLPWSLGRLLRHAGMPTDSLFAFEIAHSVYTTADMEGLGLFLRGTGAAENAGVVRALVDIYDLHNQSAPDLVRFLLATGLQPNDIVAKIVLKLQRATSSTVWNLVPRLETWFGDDWVPGAVNHLDTVQKGLEAMFAWLDEKHGDDDLEGFVLAQIVRRWENGALATVIHHCPWDWDVRGEIVAHYVGMAGDDSDDEEEEEEPLTTFFAFLSRYFIFDGTANEAQRRAFFSGAYGILGRESVLGLFNDAYWPPDYVLQANAFLSAGTRFVSPDFVHSLMNLAASGSDFERIADYICENIKSPETRFDAFGRLRSQASTAHVISILTRLDCGLQYFAELFHRRIGYPDCKPIWYPWNTANEYQRLSILDIGRSFGFIVSRKWKTARTSLLSDVNSARLLFEKFKTHSKLSSDNMAVFSELLVETAKAQQLSDTDALACLGAVLGSLCNGSLVTVDAIADILCDSVGLQRVFHKFEQLAAFFVGFGIATLRLSSKHFNELTAWTLVSGSPRLYDLTGKTNASYLTDKHRIFGERLWRNFVLDNPETWRPRRVVVFP